LDYLSHGTLSAQRDRGAGRFSVDGRNDGLRCQRAGMVEDEERGSRYGQDSLAEGEEVFSNDFWPGDFAAIVASLQIAP
jgi:hypothetical protein